ncbi:formylglycine-generating enzyme family protein [Leucothrix mucor]|uniref:formylglycine-generating enzyme family protein n=1 Tax=Leucothrix mucor TaxID=45248 RepID=UPI0003B56460|nr:formylglycine-generating enzyme family protein [Leucothrix mucor]
MTNEGQGRNGFSRADLLWGLYTSSVDEQARDELAVSLGFELEKTPAQDSTQESLDRADGRILKNLDQDLIGEETPEQSLPIEESPSKNAAYYRVSNRKINEQQSASDASDIDQLPDWFTQASATILDETKTRIPSCHRVIPLHTELTRWSRLEPFLKKILGANVSGMQVDEQQLVKQVASGKPFDRIPRKQRRSWSTKVRVLIDINEDNFPYRSDFLHLRDKLIQARGTEGLELQYIHDEPGGYVVRYEQCREFIEPWSAPKHTTLLLILSDLGMHSNTRSALYGWLVFGQLLNAQGVRPMVLMPAAERDIDKRLLRYFDCFIWDGSSDLKRVKGGYQAEKDKLDHSESIDDLLSYFFATLRVDAGLLRATRYLFNAFDIGHEVAIWQHRDTVYEGDEWGWQANSRENHQEKALKLFQQLDVKKRAKLVELIGRYHAMLPDELYFEAMHNLMLLEGLDNTGKLSGMVPEVVSQATERYMQDLVKTYAEHPDHGLLDSWVKRHLLRNQAKELRGQYDFWLAFMAFSHLHEERRTGAAESEYPDYLTEDEIAEISRYINHAKTFREYELWQQGEKLVLKSKDGEVTKKTEPEDDWGNHAHAGALLLNMTLDDERIFHVNTDRHGNQKVVSLNLSKIKKGFGFSSAREHQFQIGRELITVDVSTAQQRKEPWMRSVVSVDENGFSVESESREGSIYRWYWHSPNYIKWKSWSEAVLPESSEPKLTSHKVNSTRGVWFFSPRYSGWTPDWAAECYYDEYGVAVEAEIAGITQRFRWIEPTTFQMGSPEYEKGRLSDREVQRQVTLSQGYWLAETTCTQQLWQAVTGDNPSKSKDKANPVEQVSWEDVQNFLQLINQKQPELGLRLPTEAEWENACRAGTETPFYFGVEDELDLNKVNYSGKWNDSNPGSDSAGKILPVKSYPANQWGLYEMHGNVVEWCEDWYGEYPEGSVIDPQGRESEGLRVLRGGSWIDLGRFCRSAYRRYRHPNHRDYSIGFRLARDHGQSPVRSIRMGQQKIGSLATGRMK